MASRMVHMSRIEPHPDNARRDVGDISELAASIRARGLLQPLVVCAHPWKPNAYQLQDGHRRYAACRKLRMDQVRVEVIAATTDQTVIALTANCQREDLSAIEKAEAVERLQVEKGWSLQRISAETGLAVSTLSRFVALLDLDGATRERVRDGRVGVGDAVAAVRQVRERTRRQQGGAPRKPRVSVGPEHFGYRHPLAGEARRRCDLAGHTSRKYGKSGDGRQTACGECWEHVIREDERARLAVTT